MSEENGLSWSRKADLPADRYAAASVVHNGRIWVMGGSVAGEGASASVFTYDAEADAWETAPPLPSPCSHFRAAAVDGCIYFHSPGGSFQFREGEWATTGGGDATADPVCGAVLLG